jgi:hypothetical protein
MAARSVRDSLNETLRIELATALSAGAAAAIVTIFFRLLHQEVPLASSITYFLLGFAAYALAASILYQFWTGQAGRIVPRWLLTAVLGSLIFVIFRLTPGIIGGWLDPAESQSLGEYLANEVSAASSVFILLTVVTVPVAAAVYYSHLLASVLRVRRQEGTAKTEI